MKILPVGAYLFHANGQTDTRNLTVSFRIFVKASNEEKVQLGDC